MGDPNLVHAAEADVQQKDPRTENRIVNIHQPWVRPIVRGKTAVLTEFGAKVELSINNSFASVEEIRWVAYNEGTTLKASVGRYR